MGALSARKSMFIREYLVDLNAAQAAIRAGYSPKSAETNGPRLLRDAQVAAAVQVAMDERAKRVGMTADEVLAELKAIGMSDVRHYQFGEGSDPLVLAENAPDHAMRAVSSVKRRIRRIHKQDGPDEEIEDVEFKLWDKPTALRLAGQHLKLFGEDAGGADPNRQVVFLLPIPALNAEDWMKGVAERKAGRPVGQEIVIQPKKKQLATGKKK